MEGLKVNRGKWEKHCTQDGERKRLRQIVQDCVKYLILSPESNGVEWP